MRRGAEYGQEFVGEEVDQDLAESLQQRTLEALDLDFVLERLQALCYTATAAEMAIDPEVLLAQTPEEARALYALVVELTQLEDADLDLDAKLDIRTEANVWCSACSACGHTHVVSLPTGGSMQTRARAGVGAQSVANLGNRREEPRR